MTFRRNACAAAAALALAGSALAAGETPATTGAQTMSMGSAAATGGFERDDRSLTPGVQAGYDSETVRDVQEALRDQGIDPGPVDGIWGPRTRAGVRAFQQQQGMDATGGLNASTLRALEVVATGTKVESTDYGAGPQAGVAPGMVGGSGPRERTPRDMGAPNSAGTPGSVGIPGSAMPR